MPDSIEEELRRSFHGEAWHGPSLRDALAGLTPDEAFARPIASAHTVWELVLHLAAWTGEVARRLSEGGSGSPVEGDFPPAPGTPSAAEWDSARARLWSAEVQLIAAVRAASSERLAERVEEEWYSHAAMLHGVSQHNAYHGGQIVLLARATRSTGDGQKSGR